MEAIEVIDSAVKIGLGALISGGATYFVAKANHSAAITKEVAARKIAMINEAAELAEPYFYYNTKRLNVLGGMRRAADNGGGPMTESQIERFRATDEKLDEILASRNRALAKVHLLQLPTAETALISYNDVSTELRKMVTYDKIMPTEEQRDEFANRLIGQKNAFYKALSLGLDAIK